MALWSKSDRARPDDARTTRRRRLLAFFAPLALLILLLFSSPLSSSNQINGIWLSPSTFLSQRPRPPPDSPVWGPTAICISGDPYFLDVSGPLIMRHVAAPYSPHARVFLSSLSDEHGHKATSLSSSVSSTSAIAAVQLVNPPHGNITELAETLLAGGSQREAEALYPHYFLMEQAKKMVEEHEGKAGMRFKWVISVSTDHFWAGPAPLPDSLSPDSFTVPFYAPDDRSVNDQGGAGGRSPSLAAMARISMAAELSKKGVREEAPAHAFKAYLESAGVSLSLTQFPFCVLTSSSSSGSGSGAEATGGSRGLVLAAGSPAAINGVPCRPCKHPIQGLEAWTLLGQFPGARNLGLMLSGFPPNALQLCPPSPQQSADDGEKESGGEGDGGWEGAFDAAADAATRKIRRHISSRSDDECESEVKNLINALDDGAWSGPSARSLCLRRHMGPLVRLGSEYGGWHMFPRFLGPRCIVYNFGIGQDISWDEDMIRAFNLSVFAFDNTPRSMGWLQKQTTPPRWTHVPYLLGVEDGEVSMSLPKNHGVSFTTTDVNSVEMNSDVGVLKLPARSLETLMKDLGHTNLDILKVDIEGAEFAIFSGWRETGQEPKACQLLVEFHGRLFTDGNEKRKKAIDDLESLDFFLASTYIDSFGGDNCVFFNYKHCQ